MNKTQCCEKPRKFVSVSTKWGTRAICNNCGKPLKEAVEEAREDKLKRGAKMFARDFTGVMKELAEEEAKGDWRKMFVKKFGWKIDYEQILTFIASEIEKARREGVEEGKKVGSNKDTEWWIGLSEKQFEAGKAAVLAELLAEIKTLQKDEHPIENGVPVETYGYESEYNLALDDTRALLEAKLDRLG